MQLVPALGPEPGPEPLLGRTSPSARVPSPHHCTNQFPLYFLSFGTLELSWAVLASPISQGWISPPVVFPVIQGTAATFVCRV